MPNVSTFARFRLQTVLDGKWISGWSGRIHRHEGTPAGCTTPGWAYKRRLTWRSIYLPLKQTEHAGKCTVLARRLFPDPGKRPVVIVEALHRRCWLSKARVSRGCGDLWDSADQDHIPETQGYAREAVVLFDSDTAGTRAAMKKASLFS